MRGDVDPGEAEEGEERPAPGEGREARPGGGEDGGAEEREEERPRRHRERVLEQLAHDHRPDPRRLERERLRGVARGRLEEEPGLPRREQELGSGCEREHAPPRGAREQEREEGGGGEQEPLLLRQRRGAEEERRGRGGARAGAVEAAGGRERPGGDEERERDVGVGGEELARERRCRREREQERPDDEPRRALAGEGVDGGDPRDAEEQELEVDEARVEAAHRPRGHGLERGDEERVVGMRRQRHPAREQARVGPAEERQRPRLHPPDRPGVVVVERLRRERDPGPCEERGEQRERDRVERPRAQPRAEAEGERQRDGGGDRERGPAEGDVDEGEVRGEDADRREPEQVGAAGRRAQGPCDAGADRELEPVREQQAGRHGRSTRKTTPAARSDRAGRLGSRA